MRKKFRHLPAILGLSLLGCSARAATSYYWDINGSASGAGGTNGAPSGFWEGANWSTSSAGTAATMNWVEGNSFARFSISDATNSYTVTATNNHTIAGMLHGNFAATVTFNGSGVLSIDPTGGAGPGGAQQGFFGGTGGFLKIQNKLSGAGGVQSSSGQIFLEGTNDYAGGTTILAGLINFNNSSSFGTGLINVGVNGSAMIAEGTAAITIPNNWTNSINNAGLNCVGNAAGITYSGNIALGANTLVLGNNGVNNLDIFSGAISGSGGISRQASATHGTIRLSGASTYTGKTSLQGGTTEVASLNKVSGGSASSSLGHPTTVANGTIPVGSAAINATLRYIGAGETTDRVIDLAGTTGGATIQANGTGALVFSSDFTATGAGAKTLTLSGTSTADNTIGGKIVDSSAGATAVAKSGAGTWKLTGANTFTGGTTVSAGTLKIGPGSVKGQVTVSGGVLELDSNTALPLSGSLNLATGLPDGSVNLNYSGEMLLTSLVVNGSQASGTWGSPTSGADNTNPIFTGTGVIRIASAPVIVTEPASITCYEGVQNKSFTVVVTGDPPSYQWKLNGTDIPGANDSTYTIPIVSTSDAGTYVCFISNASGSTNTTPATLTVMHANSYVSAVLADNPVSYWRLDETSGTVAHDVMSTNDGNYVNVTLGLSGYTPVDTNTAIGMPAGAGRAYVSVPNFGPFSYTNLFGTFALEAWVNFTNLSGVQRIFSTFSGASPSWGYAFGINGANALRFTTSVVQDADQSLTTSLIPGKWYHMVLVYDGLNDQSYHFYVNGQQVGTGVPSIGANTGVSVPLQFGSNPAGYSQPEQVNGRIDEVAIYSYLNADQILAHWNARNGDLAVPVVTTNVASPATNYESLSVSLQSDATGQMLSYQWYKGATLLPGKTDEVLTISPLQLSDAGSYSVEISNPAGVTNSPAATVTVLPIPANPLDLNLTNNLVLHLSFDTNYADISGHNNNGTNMGASLISPGVIGSQALHYASDTNTSTFNYVTLGVRPDLQFGTSQDFSVSFWVRQDPGSTYTNLPFFTDAINSTGNGGFAFAPYAGQGGGGWIWTLGTASSPNAFTTFPDAFLINDGNWHHLVHVATRGSSGTCVTYLDGVQVDSQSISFLGNINTTNAATIGQDPTGHYPVTASADLDDLSVWLRPLTPLEVSGIFLAGATNGISFAPPVAPPIVPVALSVISDGGVLKVTWTGPGDLQASGEASGTYTNVPGATSPYTIPTGSADRIFYRLKY